MSITCETSSNFILPSCQYRHNRVHYLPILIKKLLQQSPPFDSYRCPCTDFLGQAANPSFAPSCLGGESGTALQRNGAIIFVSL